MDSSDFQKSKPSTVQNWKKKQEKRGENLLFWRSHSYVNRDLKKKVFTLFSYQRAARGFNGFPNLALPVKCLPTPGLQHAFCFKYFTKKAFKKIFGL